MSGSKQFALKTDYNQVFSYNRAVDDANTAWAHEQIRIDAEYQRNVADANAHVGDEYRKQGWERWEAVNATIISLQNAFFEGEGIPAAYSEYYAALAAFNLGRGEDYCKMQEQLAIQINSAGRLAQEALKKGYADYTDAIQKASDSTDKPQKSRKNHPGT